ncbi:low density lipoprotein receptor adapter protein 1-like [Sinocyclocheilus grahami]|uniref:low density lipoprotein receptor adapter protein 1-like n=1 Tax=Sinocyclocheilus grahami TaxID=75366 RepID=UPI0007AD527E|nr:PREDICTED: low density lipoprotein receptor adapter protein 1-like [Sinocyclocheilus grahami]
MEKHRMKKLQLSGYSRTSPNELPENWTDTKETLLEGMVFTVKYLGMTLVGQPKGEDMAAAAIRRIVATVSHRSCISCLCRISYCTTDKTQDKVFAYVSQSQFNEALECHAFLCQKKKIAQAVTLTVAQAFKVALDLWEIAQEDKSKKAHTCYSCSEPESQPESEPNSVSEEEKTQALMEHTLKKPFFPSFLSPSPGSKARRRPIKHDSWDLEDGLDDAFSRLATSRSRTVSEDAAVSPAEEDLLSFSSEDSD